jgi:hypothetical protein
MRERTSVKVFMLVKQFMYGTHDYGTFRTRSEAETQLTRCGPEGAPSIVEVPVFGGELTDDTVYSAACYDSVLDIHVLEGVYSSYEAANDAAGERGIVTSRTLE